MRVTVQAGLARLFAPVYLARCNAIGAKVRTLGPPRITNLGTITIGDDVTLQTSVELSAGRHATIDIGSGVRLGKNVVLSAKAAIHVGARTIIGNDVTIDDDGNDASAGQAISIGPDVVIGAGARIRKGAVIAAGSRIDANSTVEHAPLPEAVPAAVAPEPEERAVAASASPACRGLLISDFTVQDFAIHLKAADPLGPTLEVDVAPFDQVLQTLNALANGTDAKPDFAVVWTRPEAVSESFRKRRRGLPVAHEDILAEVDAFARMLASYSAAARFILLPGWVLPSFERGLGPLDLGSDGLAHILARMNLRLVEALADVTNVFVLNAQRWLAAVGPSAVNPKLWHGGKVAFSGDLFAEAALDVRATLRGLLGLSRKLIVLDLDDTLWGGIVGDVGWENLRLGGHDAVGEAHQEFQHRIQALARRGIALAIVSKNEEQVALEAFRRHPEMVLQLADISAYRINWRDKAANIVEIAGELNLGLQSLVFIDDNPVERERVREALPEVFVPDWPEHPAHYPRALESLRCFDVGRISREDLARTDLYATERERSAIKTSFTSMESWLENLQTLVRFEPLSPANLPRTSQLLNKTNQMNLRTRRLSEPELMAWSKERGHEVWAVHVSDRLGNAGLTGILSLRRHGDEVRVEDFVLSCRVMGRRVEETLVWAAVERACALGGQAVIAKLEPTAKNKPCLDFWRKTDFAELADGVFSRALTTSMAPPAFITIEGLGAPARQALHA